MIRPTIILGPPGTGKTTTLLELVERKLREGIPPERIGYVTFTRRGAEEAVTRACDQFGFKRTQLPYFRTLHSLCFRQLGLSRSDVMDTRRTMREFAEFADVDIRGRWSADGTFEGYGEGDRLLFLENLARIRGVTLWEQYLALDSDPINWNRVERFEACLRRWKREKGVVDYTDMLAMFVREGRAPGLDTLFVDEAQDLSWLQWQVVRLLAQNVRDMHAAGDDDQAIYRWAGADVEHLIGMEGDVRVLGRSWRCPAAIQSIAEGIIQGVLHRRPKEWAPREGRGFVDYADSVAAIDLSLPWRDKTQPLLILARNDYILQRDVEPFLREMGYIYERYGHPSIKPETMEAITTWEHLRDGGRAPVEQVRKVYALMTTDRGVRRGHKALNMEGEVTIQDLEDQGGLLTRAIWHEALDRLPSEELSYILAARRQGESLRQQPRIRISTIHAAKGGEGHHVILLRRMAPRTYSELVNNEEDERRVWYVGVTRAKDRLTIVSPGRRREACEWV